MTDRLYRRQELMRRDADSRDPTAVKSSGIRFRRPNTFVYDKIHLKSFSMGRKVWEAMGSPDLLTITVEVGDVRDNKSPTSTS